MNDMDNNIYKGINNNTYMDIIESKLILINYLNKYGCMLFYHPHY